MKACILAAGMGTRLGPLEHPKGFLRLGSDPIVVESLARLRAIGIHDIVIVTGHLAQFYEALPNVTCVPNPDYAKTGSLQSLRAAAGHLTEDFLLLESDILYEQRALDTLLREKGDAILLSGPTGAGDEVWVEAPDGYLVRLGKHLAGGTGELVGICRITPGLLTRLTEGVHYEDALNACAPTHRIACPLVPDLAWCEIDHADHLRRARAIYARLGSR